MTTQPEFPNLTPEFMNRVSHMTTSEMRRAAADWKARIDAKEVPADRVAGAVSQLNYIRMQIEERKSAGRLTRVLRR